MPLTRKTCKTKVFQSTKFQAMNPIRIIFSYNLISLTLLSIYIEYFINGDRNNSTCSNMITKELLNHMITKRSSNYKICFQLQNLMSTRPRFQVDGRKG